MSSIQDLERDLAALSAEAADLESRLSDVRVRRGTARQTLHFARQRAAKAAAVVEALAASEAAKAAELADRANQQPGRAASRWAECQERAVAENNGRHRTPFDEYEKTLVADLALSETDLAKRLGIYPLYARELRAMMAGCPAPKTTP